MKQKIIAILGVFIIIINFFNVSTLNVYAYHPPLEGVTEETFDGWTDVEISNWFDVNFERLIFSSNGFMNAPSAAEGLRAKFMLQADVAKAGTETYAEWIARNCDVVDDESGNPQLLISDELSDAMYLACQKYIAEECGWYEWNTMDYRNFPASFFPTQGLYNTFISYCTQNVKGTDNTIFASPYIGGFSETDDSGVEYTHYRMALTEPLANVEYYSYSNGTNGQTAYVTQEWETKILSYYYFYDGESSLSGEIYTTRNLINFEGGYSITTPYAYQPITDGVKTVRVYKTLEDLKSYSVGQRPYYITDKFQDYDINGDNSCILSESDLSNGSVYGDVYNYIINNYDNPDGLTENELRDILDDYFNNSGGGSGSSGNGSGSGSSGNGLMDFLGGLGSIGDAILSILGKLLEYIGKALDLISGTVTKVIDIIPKNITALLGALFPFLPEEWLTAIELGLVLAVIVGIVGLFKK